MRRVILVTGGTGLLGERIVSRLVHLGHRVRILSRRPLLGDVDRSVEVVNGDIRNGKLVEEAVSGCDAVFHCAAEARDVNTMYEVNVSGTKNVYEAARKNEVHFFCHLSSVGVIGKTNQPVVDEDAPCAPMNIYERSKLEAERIVECGIKGCSIVILRPTNVFAEDTFDIRRYRGVHGTLRVWFTGKERSHLVYAGDVAEAGAFLLESWIQPGCQKFIVSSDEEPDHTNVEVYESVQRLLGYWVERRRWVCPLGLVYYLRLLRHGRGNRGDVCYSARRLLSTGFKMPFGLLEGIRRSVECSQRKQKVAAPERK